MQDAGRRSMHSPEGDCDMPAEQKSAKLWQEIVLTLLLKVILLTCIWAVWFSAPQDQTIDGQQAAVQILSPQLQKEAEHDAVTRTR